LRGLRKFSEKGRFIEDKQRKKYRGNYAFAEGLLFLNWGFLFFFLCWFLGHCNNLGIQCMEAIGIYNFLTRGENR
jgi:hypothetical protein